MLNFPYLPRSRNEPEQRIPDARWPRVSRGILAVAILCGMLTGGSALFAGVPARAALSGLHSGAPARPPAKRTRPPGVSPLALAQRGRWELEIPRIRVSSKLLVLGNPRGGLLPVPSVAQATQAAWYQFTAVPGDPGSAVLVGHVDTLTGPGVFYALYALEKGDPIFVRVGGRRMRFAVTAVTEVPKKNFPVNEVFGGTTARMLRIITCGGNFDYATRHYLDNIVVSAAYRPADQHKHQ